MSHQPTSTPMSDDDDDEPANKHDNDDEDDLQVIQDIKPPALGRRQASNRLKPSLSLSKPSFEAPSRASAPLPPLPHEQTWLRFDDSRVEYKSQAELDSLIGSESKSLATAYIMFYHRID